LNLKRAVQLDKLRERIMTTHNTTGNLTVEYIKSNIGKEITWHAYGAKSNHPYKGVCKLLGFENNRPVIEHIKGDDLSFGWAEDGLITYSDSGRLVRIGSAFDIYNLKWDVESQGMSRANGNPMTYSIVVYNGEDLNEVARKATTATEFDIEHIV
jgi:hypothetical protein